MMTMQNMLAIQTGIVKDGNGEHVGNGPAQDAGTVRQLRESVNGVLEPGHFKVVFCYDS